MIYNNNTYDIHKTFPTFINKTNGHEYHNRINKS